ncbi:ubiquitin carboxyl-terminal hydrolase [Mitosporidium daphniae]|uniref:Ubiquitin carboxyl-terminal hydrolase n=1 Tax=Mitosporidium daphniae TaxID=1485682 RepID=A0A098VX77_9MICR|nr:ubiquitin carboxyl-terminal hydrolase [Mitosporidium daphniae]KGG52341.1 ubiquitin carboxyl-terminal hydrolase [Mitosporidium daphniae]|eukprot:XP_013238777.1 ubiquitin carboxyl-terminal hydrolase [Mitosporidium daphniae]
MALRTQCFDGFMRKIKNNFCALYVFGGRAKRPNFSSRQKGVGGNRVETQNVALDHISKRKGAVCIGARLLSVKIASIHLASIKADISGNSIAPTNRAEQLENEKNLLDPFIDVHDQAGGGGDGAPDASAKTPKKATYSRSSPVAPRGLPNIRNNCYLNSLFQSLLSASEVILSEFNNKIWYHRDAHTQSKEKKYIARANVDRTLLGFAWFPNETEIEFPSSLASQFASIWKKWPNFGNGRQQDVHEVLLELLDALHVDFSATKKSVNSEFRISTFDGLDGIASVSQWSLSCSLPIEPFPVFEAALFLKSFTASLSQFWNAHFVK